MEACFIGKMATLKAVMAEQEGAKEEKAAKVKKQETVVKEVKSV